VVSAIWVGAGFRPAQTLSETTNWLKDFIAAEGKVSGGNWRDTYQLLVSGCDITVFHDTEDISCTKPETRAGCHDSNSVIHSFRQVFNLKDIDLGRIETTPEPSFGAFTVALTTLNERPLVQHAVKLDGKFEAVSVESPHTAYVVVQTRDAADRIAKAFQQAATLCGAKRSPL
jgi:hypothetical protein